MSSINPFLAFRTWFENVLINPDNVKITVEFPTRHLKQRAAEAFVREMSVVGRATHDQFETGTNTVVGIKFNFTVAKCPTCKREQ